MRENITMKSPLDFIKAGVCFLGVCKSNFTLLGGSTAYWHVSSRWTAWFDCGTREIISCILRISIRFWCENIDKINIKYYFSTWANPLSHTYWLYTSQIYKWALASGRSRFCRLSNLYMNGIPTILESRISELRLSEDSNIRTETTDTLMVGRRYWNSYIRGVCSTN